MSCPTPSSSVNVRTRTDDIEWKLVHPTSQRFKLSDAKFKCTSGEAIKEYFSTYEITPIDYKLDDDLKFQYLYNLFDDEAKRNYRDKIYNKPQTYEEAKTKMIEKYINFTKHKIWWGNICKIFHYPQLWKKNIAI